MRDANLLNLFDTAAVHKLHRNHQTPTLEEHRPKSRAVPSTRCLSDWSLGWQRTANAGRHAEAAAALTVTLDASCDYGKPSAPHPDMVAPGDVNAGNGSVMAGRSRTNDDTSVSVTLSGASSTPPAPASQTESSKPQQCLDTSLERHRSALGVYDPHNHLPPLGSEPSRGARYSDARWRSRRRVAQIQKANAGLSVLARVLTTAENPIMREEQTGVCTNAADNDDRNGDMAEISTADTVALYCSFPNMRALVSRSLQQLAAAGSGPGETPLRINLSRVPFGDMDGSSQYDMGSLGIDITKPNIGAGKHLLELSALVSVLRDAPRPISRPKPKNELERRRWARLEAHGLSTPADDWPGPPPRFPIFGCRCRALKLVGCSLERRGTALLASLLSGAGGMQRKEVAAVWSSALAACGESDGSEEHGGASDPSLPSQSMPAKPSSVTCCFSFAELLEQAKSAKGGQSALNLNSALQAVAAHDMIDGVSAPNSTSDDSQREAEAWALRSLDLRHNPKIPPDSVLSHLRPHPRSVELANDNCRTARSSGIDESIFEAATSLVRAENQYGYGEAALRAALRTNVILRRLNGISVRLQPCSSTMSSSDLAGQQPTAEKLLMQEGHCNLSGRKLTGYEMTFIAMRVLLHGVAAVNHTLRVQAKRKQTQTSKRQERKLRQIACRKEHKQDNNGTLQHSVPVSPKLRVLLLASLDLSRCGLTGAFPFRRIDPLEELVAALLLCPSLRELELASNALFEAGVTAVMPLIEATLSGDEALHTTAVTTEDSAVEVNGHVAAVAATKPVLSGVGSKAWQDRTPRGALQRLPWLLSGSGARAHPRCCLRRLGLADNGLGDGGGNVLQCALLRAAHMVETGIIGGENDNAKQFDIDLRFNGIGLEVRDQHLPAAVKALSDAVQRSSRTGKPLIHDIPNVELRLYDDELKKSTSELED
eukprot:g477.t1